VNLNFKDYMMFICSKIIKSALATTGFKDTEHTSYLYTLVLLVAGKTKMIFREKLSNSIISVSQIAHHYF